MSSILNHFITLTKIPHCSKGAHKLQEFLTSFAKEQKCEVQCDTYGNILISKGTPKLCLQAHYDMVCMGSAPDIETYEVDGKLKAKGSSLGADNGMAIAMMMELMMRGAEDIEYLLTSDEEIGLIGASALSFAIKSPRMLNLDSEEEAEVYIGCAGGADVVATKSYPLYPSNKKSYRITIGGLPGGHSGVDIDKGIPNALKLFASLLKGKKIDIVSLKGGERRNSIPVSVEAIIKCDTPITGHEWAQIEEIACDQDGLYGSSEIIDTLHGFLHGVHDVDYEFGIPSRSANLAIVTIHEGECTIETSVRAMDGEGLAKISREIVGHFDAYGYTTTLEEKYPAWRPQVGPFTTLVNESLQEVFGKSRLVAIHAGLECGVIYEKYPHLQIASIGPTIRFPHSTREEVEIASVEKTFEALGRILEKV